MPDPDAIDLTDNLLAKADDAPIFTELGNTGLAHWGGSIYEEPIEAVAGAKGIKIFKEMALNDPVVSAILYAIDTLARQVEWEVDPPDDTSGGEEAADFLKECMEDMSHSWEDFISEVLSMHVYGWSAFELIYKKRVGPSEEDSSQRSRFSDNKIGWRKFSIRSQETLARWEFTDDGGIAGLWQQAPPDYALVPIPITKLLLFRTEGHKNNPEGKSLLRGAWRAWRFKKRVEEHEGIGIERDLAGIPIAYVQKRVLLPGASAEDKAYAAAMKKLVSNVRRNEQEGIVFPIDYDDQGRETARFELLTSGGKRNFDTSAIITRWDQRIAMTVLADFIMLGHANVGSYSLSSDKTDIFTMTLKVVLDNIASVINRHAIPRLFAINGMPTDSLPQVRPGDIEKPDLASLGTFLQTLGQLQVPLAEDPETIQWFRTLIGAPQLADETIAALASQPKEPPVAQPGQPAPPKAQPQQVPPAAGANGNGKQPAAQQA